MIVITVSNCPQKLRGDLTKWLFEIDTGIFVGNLSARVRDAVWKRVCENIESGRAAMVFNTNSEQKLDFRIHNSDWEPVDYDGIKLVRRRYPNNMTDSTPSQSKAKQQHIVRNLQRNKKSPYDKKSYVVIDIETTGLQTTDKIIEIGALYIEDGEIKERYSVLLKCLEPLSKAITGLTALTNEILMKEGIEAKEALEGLLKFCGDKELVGHNIQFDLQFLHSACIENGLPFMRNNTTDTMRMARRKIDCDEGYGLRDIAKYLEIEYNEKHRALEDCILAYRIFEKLKDF